MKDKVVKYLISVNVWERVWEPDMTYVCLYYCFFGFFWRKSKKWVQETEDTVGNVSTQPETVQDGTLFRGRRDEPSAAAGSARHGFN